jgi:hypothetical protein
MESKNPPVFSVNLSSQKDVKKFFEDNPPPLNENTVLLDSKTGKFYVVKDGLTLKQVHNPFSGEHMVTKNHFLGQSFVSPLNTKDRTVLHSLYLGEKQELVDEVGVPVSIRDCEPSPPKAWMSTFLRTTFGEAC